MSASSPTTDLSELDRHVEATVDTVDPKVHQQRWLILAVLCTSLLIIVIDNTILNVAIPSLIRDLDASNSQIQWIIDGYVLVFAGLLLTAGSLSDRFGRKGALQLGLVLFALGSMASVMADTAEQLIFTRAFMGIGGALIMPSTLSILTNVFHDPKERGRAIAIWAGFSGLAVALGPMIGGLLLEHYSWHSVFLINIPVAGVALVAGAFIIPKSRDPKQSRLDPVGAVLSIIGLATLLFGIIEGPEKGWSSDQVIAAFAIAAVALVAFVLWERHSRSPMLDMSLFANPRFTAASSTITLVFFALFGSLFLMTQYWQLVHGYSPLEAGVRLLPHAATMMIVAPLSARVVEKVGTKRVVLAGLAMIMISLALLSTIEADSSYPLVISYFMLMAAGMGMTMAPATESVMGSVPRTRPASAPPSTTRRGRSVVRSAWRSSDPPCRASTSAGSARWRATPGSTHGRPPPRKRRSAAPSASAPSSATRRRRSSPAPTRSSSTRWRSACAFRCSSWASPSSWPGNSSQPAPRCRRQRPTTRPRNPISRWRPQTPARAVPRVPTPRASRWHPPSP